MVTNEYRSWVSALKKRYRATQIKAAVAVNSAMLEFYWSLGADISRMYPGKKRNLNFFENLSNDLCLGINPRGRSSRNLKYALAFYRLYSYRQQVVADKSDDDCLIVGKGKEDYSYLQQVVEDKSTACFLHGCCRLTAEKRMGRADYWPCPVQGRQRDGRGIRSERDGHADGSCQVQAGAVTAEGVCGHVTRRRETGRGRRRNDSAFRSVYERR